MAADAFNKSAAECAYLAGVVDGEGCIGVYKDKRYYKLILVVASTSLDWLCELRMRWDGAGHVNISQPKPGEKRRAKGQWVVKGSVAQGIIACILPYLGIKKDQAELALQFRPLRPKSSENTGRYLPIPDEDRAEQIRIAKTLKELKQVPSGKLVDLPCSSTTH